MVTSSFITYGDILTKLLTTGTYKNQMLVLENVVFVGELQFSRYQEVEKYININIDKKVKYIKKTYHTGKITKKNPCIESIDGNVITFRSARAFPTLYLDLLVLNEKFKGQVITIKFKKLFIGYHILGASKFLPTMLSNSFNNYSICLTHWKNRFKKDKLSLSMLIKYKKFLESL